MADSCRLLHKITTTLCVITITIMMDRNGSLGKMVSAVRTTRKLGGKRP